MAKRSFTEHLIGIKKTAIFILVCYLLVVVPLILSLSAKSDLLGFSLFILAITILIGWILYYQFAEYNRLQMFIIDSGVKDFLTSNNFQISERNTGWNYMLEIQGNYKNCFLILELIKQKGNIWNKYFIELHGTIDSKKLEPTSFTGKIQTFAYPELIRLTKDSKSKIELKTHLDSFVNQLTDKK